MRYSSAMLFACCAIASAAAAPPAFAQSVSPSPAPSAESALTPLVSASVSADEAASVSLSTTEQDAADAAASSKNPNLVPNGNLEQSSGGLPLDWKEGGYGSNTRAFTYPASGVGGSAAASVTISKYSSGDADWYFDPLSLSPGVYRFTDYYKSTAPSLIELQLHNSDGSYSYTDLKSLSASPSGFATTAVSFTVPVGTKDVVVYQLIEQKGTLTVDDTAVRLAYAFQGVYLTGGVTLRFDDGWASQYSVALPALEAAGFKGTFFIITHQVLDDGYSGFMSIKDVQNLYADGEEIGDHTQTHPYLSKLSANKQKQEIVGALGDLHSWGISNVQTFAYPYGDYDSTTVKIVKNAGFASAAATLDGDVPVTQNPYTLNGYSVVDTDTPASIEAMVAQAMRNHQWLILTFHQIDASGDEYSITPANFKKIVSYLKSNGIPVVTVSQGAADLEKYGN